MRILKISIDGYGKIAGRKIELSPGLQVILGPNEQGKSTVRSFVGDMLYGQKQTTGQDAYDDTNELRLPWTAPDCYGGSLVYTTDDGTEYEVHRNFDRERESIHLYDRTNAREVAGDYELLRNGEISFAQAHLGLSKDVFLSAATISHFSLEDLGDSDALNQIREKLLSLADTGGESSSADAALKLMQTRINAIGQSATRTKPLPAARARAAELDQELVAAQRLLEAVGGEAEKRRGILEEIAALRKQRLALEDDLRLIEAHARARRLREGESLLGRIDTATKHCFALGAVREFPLDRTPEVQRAENLAQTARRQLERTQSELETSRKQLEKERRESGSEQVRAMQDLPEDLETRYSDTHNEVRQLEKQLTDIRELVTAAEKRLKDSQADVQSMPDFSSVSSDPVEIIMQLASSFRVAVKSRGEERTELGRLKEATTQKRVAIADNHTLFKDLDDFTELARDYELNQRGREDKIAHRQATLHSLKSHFESETMNAPQFRWLSVACVIGLGALGAAWLQYRHPAIFMPAGLAAMSLIYFLLMYLRSTRRLGRLSTEIATMQSEVDGVSGEDGEEQNPIEAVLEKSGCVSLRELEARYQRYRETYAELSAHIHMLRGQETRVQEAEERITQMLERYQQTFKQLGEEIASEDDVETAARSATGRYQEYRESKRRLSDCIRALEDHKKEQTRLETNLSTAQASMKETETSLRAFMRENGFEDEERQPTTGAALRGYRARLARHRELRGRVELLQEKLHASERQLKNEELELEKHDQELSRLLAHAGVSTVEQWHTMAAQAREYQEVWDKRAGLEQQLDSLLGDDEIATLRTEVEADGDLPPAPDKGRDAIKAEIDTLSLTIDDRMKEEHALHIAITERSAGYRSVNEIEEEKAWIQGKINSLDLEREAASYAMAVIEEIARDKHARIAPKLAERASLHLALITGGAYDEVLISRDLEISVRIPETNRMHEHPEKSLSKGTVDQIYLALRLALVESISENGESIPMLLDDPFANYDDQRLGLTMQLIQGISAHNQVLLFTCREDVARAAERVQAPVIRL